LKKKKAFRPFQGGRGGTDIIPRSQGEEKRKKARLPNVKKDRRLEDHKKTEGKGDDMKMVMKRKKNEKKQPQNDPANTV